MRIEAGISPSEPIVSTPEKNRLSPSEIQDIITKSHLGTYRNEKKYKYIVISQNFFEEYKKSPEGLDSINRLTNTVKGITEQEIQQSFISGLSKSLSIAESIPELSDYQPNDINQSFAHRFHLIVESFERVSSLFPPSKSMTKKIIEHPNYVEPNFYEYYANQIKEDSYYCPSNIGLPLWQSPRTARKKLEQNNKIFESVKKTLEQKNPTEKINYWSVRTLVEQKGTKAINIASKNPTEYYITPKKTIKKDKNTSQIVTETRSLETEKRKLETKNKTLTTTSDKLKTENLNLRKQRGCLKKENRSLKSQITALQKRIERLSGTLKERKNSSPKIIPDDLVLRGQTTQIIPKENATETTLTPSHPIDKISSANLTPEQIKKIKKIKSKTLNNNFAQDWIIEYYVIKHPDQSEQEIIQKIQDTKVKMDEWKGTIANKNFIDDWILQHFIVYYPQDFKNRYEEAHKAYTELFAKYKETKKGFTTTDTLKKIVVYYNQNRDKAIETGLSLYSKLDEKFSKTKLVNFNSAIINRYIIRNFDNPAENLKQACQDFDSLLKKASTNPDDFFNSNLKFEIYPGKYLQLLFENYPIDTLNSVSKIENVYQKLSSRLKNDSFFGNYKTLALKIIAITSTEKPTLCYEDLKKQFKNLTHFYSNYGIEEDYVFKMFLMFPNIASSMIEAKIPAELRGDYKRQIKRLNI